MCSDGNARAFVFSTFQNSFIVTNLSIVQIFL